LKIFSFFIRRTRQWRTAEYFIHCSEYVYWILCPKSFSLLKKYGHAESLSVPINIRYYESDFKYKYRVVFSKIMSFIFDIVTQVFSLL